MFLLFCIGIILGDKSTAFKEMGIFWFTISRMEESIIDIILHVAWHSLVDTLYLVPFLFVTYFAMEWLEHKTGSKTQSAVARAGNAGPIVGALLGAIPQCGFSAMGATFYAGRVITLGTLFAVFLSTSDEMLPVFLAEQVPVLTIASILGAKIVIGMVMGLAIDAILRVAARDKEPLRIHELCEHDHCDCAHDCATCENNPIARYEHSDDCAHGCEHDHHEHDHSHDSAWGSIFKSAVKHTVQVMLFIFVITLVLNAVLETVGEDALADFLADKELLSVFASALVGLIPNCAASLVIAQLYIDGVLSSGAMLAGLLTSAGVGVLVLARANRRPVQNVLIIFALYAIGVAWGLIAQLFGVVF
jgi:hypothetical protein